MSISSPSAVDHRPSLNETSFTFLHARGRFTLIQCFHAGFVLPLFNVAFVSGKIISLIFCNLCAFKRAASGYAKSEVGVMFILPRVSMKAITFAPLFHSLSMVTCFS